MLTDAVSPQVEGKWSHSGGLIKLGTPQRGRPAGPQLQSHLDEQKYAHDTQAHAHAARTHTQQHAHLSYPLTANGAGQTGESHQSDSGGREPF